MLVKGAPDDNTQVPSINQLSWPHKRPDNDHGLIARMTQIRKSRDITHFE